MNRAFGNRQLLFICIVLVLLVGILAAVQYRWSARIAAADAQREREHLESSSTLFVTKFNASALRAVEFIQNDAWKAHKAGQPINNVPRLIGELYLVDFSGKDAHVKRLSDQGTLTDTSAPQWLPQNCATGSLSNPPALVTPVYNVDLSTGPAVAGLRILQAISSDSSSCFVARINDQYVRDELAPSLIRESFGDSSIADYDFSIHTRGSNPTVVYGPRVTADISKPIFSVIPGRLRQPTSGPGPAQGNRVFVQRFESTIVVRGHGGPADLFGDGIWQLDVAHKGVSLEKAFERVRWRNLLLSVAVEALLIAAVVFLAISVRRMQRLAEQKMQFVASVSHELRTPVSSISMLSKNQADGLVTGADRVRQYGELIHQESRRLSDMVEQTLRYAGMHSGLRRKQNNRFDLRMIIQEAVDARRDDFQRHNIEVEVDIPDDLPQVAGNPSLLRTALDNLLNNAERHASEGRWIRIGASHSPADKEIIISVEDHGPGIDPKDQTEIFEPFSRGPAAIAAQIPGSGLGLSLVRSAAEAHNGTVTVESEPGRGSTFKLHLPI